jgi:signal transduction histidine kinase/CHASE2 domain-containing sensor protein
MSDEAPTVFNLRVGDEARGRGWTRTLLTSVLLFVTIGCLCAIPFVRNLQLRLTDTYFRLARAETASPVVLVLIDDESLRQYGRWPWSRELLAQLTHNIARAGANSIGLDILLSEPQSAAADTALSNAFAAASPRIVLVNKIGMLADGPGWISPLPEFSRNARVGHAQAVLDIDGVCRSFSPRQLTTEGSQWAFAIEVARRADPHATAAFLRANDIPVEDDSAAISNAPPVLVPIAFRQGAFDTISAARVLRGENLDRLWRRPVLVGFGPTEIADRLNTPVSRGFPTPGVEVHAHIVDSILAERELHPVALAWSVVFLAVTCVVVVDLFRHLRGWPTLLAFAALAFGVYGIGALLFLAMSRILPIGPMLLAVVLGPLFAYTGDFMLVERSVAHQLRELRELLAVRHNLSAETSSDLSWRLAFLQDLQSELASLYELHDRLLEATHDLIGVFDAHGSLLLKNRRFAAAFQPFGDAGLTLDEVLSRLKSAPDSPPISPGEEAEAQLDGELYSVRMFSLPGTSMSPAGGMILTLSSLRSRVERDRARAEALGFITHELRTPLVAIQGFAELMLRYPNSPMCSAAPKTIHRESKRLLALINSYLDVLRLDAGARPVRSESVVLDKAVREVFEILQTLAEPRGMKLVLDSMEPVEVQGDPHLLSGAILNLVSNAIKYSEPEGTIRVQCLREHDTASVFVHNTGEPISEKDLPHLFDAYYRGTKTEHSTPGWGLGLAFVKRIVDKHGGQLRVTSDSGGTSFEIRLPAPASHALENAVRRTA